MSAERALVGFGRALRTAGLPVDTRRLIAFREAAELLPEGELYWAGRATLVARRDEIPVFDRVFRAYFSGGRESARLTVRLRPRLRAVPLGAHAQATGAADPAVPGVALASATEVLRRKSFAACSADELAEIARLQRRLRLATPPRRSRRRAPSRTGEPDLRRTLRAALRTGGELLSPARRQRRLRRRRLVLLVDVSGSMSPYARPLVDFAHATVRADRRFEAFAFGTRLTRLTRALDTDRLDDARWRAAEAAADWDGGTRIGASLKTFCDRYGRPGLARGAVVVICSDGLEVGDPEALGAQMEVLHRLAHRVVWLNPLKENRDYEPLARGMAAALPWIDVFASGHSLESLEAIAPLVESLRLSSPR